MGFEVEFHPVGDGTKAGDAITIRYGAPGAYEVIVVDGGTTSSGESIVAHIKQYYGENVVISHVVSTHPDTDHICGLREVLDAFTVTNLWIHGLYYHAANLLPYFSGNWSADGLEKAIKEKYPLVAEVIDKALEKGTAVYQPFQGAQIGPFTVLSPSLETYLTLVPQFRKTPEANKEVLEAAGVWSGVKERNLLLQLLEKAAAAVTNWVGETWDLELLKDGGTTAAENESSAVLLGVFEDKTVLLTGDAGVNALTNACDYADQDGLVRSPLRMIQVPHHGSRSNVGPTILNRFLGAPGTQTTELTAVVSCPVDDEKHPRKMVVNAFKRRGCRVVKTNGNRLRHHNNMPARGDEVSATEYPWFDQVEAYD